MERIFINKTKMYGLERYKKGQNRVHKHVIPFIKFSF